MSETRRPEIGIDYFTATTENQVAASQFLAIAEIERSVQSSFGDFPKAIQFHGYSGWRVKTCQYAQNQAGKVHFSLFGATATDHWFKYNKVVGHTVKRLDLAVTIELAHPRNLAKLGYAEKLGPRSVGVLRNTKKTIFLNDDGGATLYVGKRGGERFGRIYDKGVQAGVDSPGRLWRFEAEFRRHVAQAVFNTIARDNDPWRLIPAIVFDHFRKRGITPPFERGIRTYILERYTRVTDPETKLAWLSRSVAPCITQLMLAGFSEEVYNALGLQKSERIGGPQHTAGSE